MHSEDNSRKMALLALAANDEKEESNCPSDEVFSAYVDGVLNGEVKQQVTAHLNHCLECRNQWLEITRVTHEVGAEITARENNAVPLSLIERMKAIVEDWFSMVSIPATAATLSLAFVVTLMLVDTDAPPFVSKLDDQYQQLSAQLSLRANKGEGFPMPWDNAVMAFNSNAPSVAQRALGAGLWQSQSDLGINKVETENPFPAPEVCCWEQTQWDGYYYLGRWLGLLWWQTHLLENDGSSMESDQFDWGNDRAILQSLQGKLVTMSDADRIPNTNVELDKLNQQLAKTIDATKLNRQVLNTIHRLGPTTYE